MEMEPPFSLMGKGKEVIQSGNREVDMTFSGLGTEQKWRQMEFLHI